MPIVNCNQCGKEINIRESTYNRSKTKLFYCNRSCAAKYNNSKRILSQETKDKISKKLTKRKIINRKSVVKKIIILTCKICGCEFIKITNKRIKCCSKECLHKSLSNSGKKSVNVQGDARRSKNEIEFHKLCVEKFNKVLSNETMFNGWDADIIIEDIKYAILWNGNWHHKQITEKHSLVQVQNRDKIKVKEIINTGYIPYIINDYGKFNVVFVEEKFEEFIEYINNDIVRSDSSGS